MKKQFKKSLSLFLAVLMLLSCWVWVAPEKAEAAYNVSDNYKVEIVVDVSNPCDAGHVTCNGTAVISSLPDSFKKEGTQTLSFETTSFPTTIFLRITTDARSTSKGTIKSIKINGKTVLSGSWEYNTTKVFSSGNDDFTFTPNANGTGGNVSGTWDWKKPEFAQIRELAVSGDVEISKLPNGAEKTVTVSVKNGYDQYGVKFDGTVPATAANKITYELKRDETTSLTSTYGTIKSDSDKGTTATVTLNDDIQTLFPNASNGKIYAYATHTYDDHTKTVSIPINLTFPTYKATFDANGGLIGADSSSGKKSVEIDVKNYGSIIGKSPAFRSRDGFDFKGYYSTKYADAKGLKTTFDKEKKFIDNETKVPDTGDSTWYAAWQAKPITATFVTQDGQLIAKVEGRHNNYMTNTDMYNGLNGLNTAVKGAHENNKIKFDSNNAPVYTDGSTTFTFDGWRIIEATGADDPNLYDTNGDGVVSIAESPIDKDEDFVIKGAVTFQAVYSKPHAATYTVTFEDGNGNNASTKSGYKYREAVTNVPTEDPVKATDDRYDYEFIGWAKDIGNDFYAVDENDNDADGARIVYTSKDAAEFTVKGDITYVPVFRMIPREYTVTYNYTVDGGETGSVDIGGFHWHDTPATPEIKDNYTKGGYRYYLLGWEVNNSGAAKPLDQIAVEGDMTLTAVYGNSEKAKYTINFYGKDADGETDILLNGDTNIYDHYDEVSAPEVPTVIETEEARYVFQGWSPSIATIANGDADYKAIYEKKVYTDLHFYNYDGTLIYEWAGKDHDLFVGEKIPAYSNLVENEDGTTENVLPSKPADVVGEYIFSGWQDSAGKPVEPGVDLFTGETFLTAQYDTEYTDYTVKFINDELDENGEKVIVSEKTYHYGEEITVPADPTKRADVEYIYDFRAWSPDVSSVCYGNATYIATYRRTQKYYTVTWLNDKKEVFTESNYAYNTKIQQPIINNPANYPVADAGKKWVIDYWVTCNENGDPINAQGNIIDFNRYTPSGLLTNEAYGYKGQIDAINSDETLTQEEKDVKIAIITYMAPIEYCSKYVIKFNRGQKMSADHLYFYPVFKQQTNVLSVTFFKEDGKTFLGYANIPYGDNINDYAGEFAAKAPKLFDDTNHYKIENWVKIDGEGNDILDGDGNQIVVSEITENISVRATYTAEAHNPVLYEVISEPTCNIPGFAKYKCEADECDRILDNVMIPPVDDFVAPTGQLYVGNIKWTLDDYKNDIDYNDVKFVGPGTYVVANAEDLNDSSMPYNPDGKLNRGVGKIEYYVSEGTTDPEKVKDWTPVYDYEENRQQALNAVLAEKKLTTIDYTGYSQSGDKVMKAEIDRAVDALLSPYKANATDFLANLGLEDGNQYVIYIKISEREGAGEAKVSYLSSGTIQYGTKAPKIAITGVGYGSTFCEEATITVTDDTDGFSTYFNGVEVELTNGKFTCKEEGMHEVTVIDKNGNKTTKTFEIAGGHTNRIYLIAATCTENGTKYAVCTVCGAKSETTETIPATGHSFWKNYVDKAPTCDADGYRTYVCDNNCGTKLELRFNTETGYLDAAELAKVKTWDEEKKEWIILTAAELAHLKSDGKHTYAKVKDEKGEDTLDDVWVIDKAATCQVVGSKHKDCTKCGIKGRVVEEIPLDTVNGHKFYRAKVTTEPTCTTEGKKTRVCRYEGCGYEEVTKIIEPLGHDEGAYEVIAPADCTTAGSEVLKCTVCKDIIGDVREIPALGHRMKKSNEEPFEKLVAGEDGIAVSCWFQKYECKACDFTEERALPGYIPPVAATVTFDFNGGYYVVPAVGEEGEEGYVAEQHIATQSIAGFVGDSITADEIKKAVKDADATYSYTFAYWATKDQYGNYTEVKLPIVVDGDATFYAVYENKNVNYNVTFLREDFSEFKVTGYHHNGSTVDFVDAPKKDGYKFAGWAKVVYTVTETGVDKQVTEIQDVVRINGENVTLIAVYEPVPVYYMVTYTTNKNGTEDDVIERFNVLNGGFARECGIEPTKAPDMLGHYEFVRWDREADLVYVKSDIVTEPVYRTIEHNYIEVEKSAATCTTDKIVTKTCEDCGFSYDYAVAGTAGHIWTDWTEDTYGNKSRECTVCGTKETEAAPIVTYTITYYNADGSVYVVSTSVPENAPLKDFIIKTGPAKATDETNTYEFIGWASKDDVNSIPLTVTGNLELVPVYEATKRSYKVIFAYDGKNIISETEVKAGEEAKCSVAVNKAYDAENHYVFTKWSKDVSAVYSNIYTTAEFKAEAHKAVVTKTVPATCYENAIETYECDCGYTYDKVVVGSAGHKWVEGVCSVCGITTGGREVTYKLAYLTESESAYRYAYNILDGAKLAEIVLNYGPAKASDNEKTYTFDKWVIYKKDATTGAVTEEAITDDTEVKGNVVLYPKYTDNARKYKVIFAYNAEDIILEKLIDAGKKATCATTPVKKADSKYHYEFDGWNRAAELEKVFSNIYTTPNFKSVAHKFTKTETPATCETNKKITYTCTCGYNYTIEVPDSLAGHTWGEGVKDDNGKIVYTCTVCEKATKTETATYKVEYCVDDVVVATVEGVEHGTLLSTMLGKEVSKAEDKENTYKFNSWTLDEKGTQAPAEDDVITGDIKLYAKFDGTPRKYIVIFAYDAQNIIDVVEVEAGSSFAELAKEIKAKKAYDDDYHYTFKEWNKSVDAVYENIYTTAIFTADAHDYEVKDVKDADCTTDKEITYACSCGKTYTEKVEGTKGHKWSETTDEAGNKIKKCSGCGKETTEGLKFTVTYYVDNKVVATKNYVEYGTKLADILSTSKPGKDADNAFIYTFKEWKIDGTTSVGDTLVTRDIALHAYYEKTDRLYTVMFGHSSDNLFMDAKVEGVKYGEISASLYKGADPAKAYDDNNHYVFNGWKLGNYTSDTYFFYADFKGVAHSKYVDNDASTAATCTQAATKVTKCTGCAFNVTTTVGKPKPHSYKLIEDVPAQKNQDGYKKYQCEVCKDEYKDIIKWENPEAGNVTITIVVKENANGTPAIAHAKVDLYSGNTWIATEFTNEQGIAKFSVAKGKYRAIVSGIEGAGSTEFTFDATKDGQTVESPKISIKHCGCACHNTGIWGKIFRFFHKIIQKITGEFKCCSDPSYLYN